MQAAPAARTPAGRRGPGWSTLSGRADGVKKRKASKCEQAIRCDSTTRSVPAGPRRSGQSGCRVVSSPSRCTIAHSCRPKQPKLAGRAAVADEQRRASTSTRASAARRGRRATPRRSEPVDGVPLPGRALLGVRQRDAEAGVPAPQLGRTLGVVGEEEVVDRVRLRRRGGGPGAGRRSASTRASWAAARTCQSAADSTLGTPRPDRRAPPGKGSGAGQSATRTGSRGPGRLPDQVGQLVQSSDRGQARLSTLRRPVRRPWHIPKARNPRR